MIEDTGSRGPTVDDWRPTCSLDVLRLRSAALASVRSFFTDLGYLEVETPILSHDVVVDAHLDPFEIPGESKLYLQTSPEAGMKRLLAAGSGSIFQIGKSFRAGECGAHHNPEFTMVEWYGVATTWRDQAQLTESLVRCVRAAMTSEIALGHDEIDLCALSDQSFAATSYRAVFLKLFQVDVFGITLKQLQQLAAEKTSFAESSYNVTDRDDLLNILVAECIEPKLGRGVPEYLHDYPISQAALAEANPDNASTALRFELYWNGIELCNGYQELCDPDELARRDDLHNESRCRRESEALPGAARMMHAMQHGLPPCSGVALGLDRLLMVLLNMPRIQDVIPFPIDRA